MTDYENVLVEIDGPVATITLNRPEKLNAISGGLRDDLEAALRDLNPGDAVRVIRRDVVRWLGETHSLPRCR